MPYGVRPRGGKHVVVNTETGKVMGRHDTPAKAKRQLAALNANVKEMLAETETFSKPGTADVTPSDRVHLKGLLAHYAKLPHPFTTCVRDQMKHGLPKDHADRRCAVIKDLIRGTTSWRGKAGEALTEAEADVLADYSDDLLERAAQEFPELLAEAKLTTQGRKNLPSSAFVFPKDKRYPIHDRGHAENALARSSGKSEEGTVRAAVCRRYKDLCKNKSAQEMAIARGAVRALLADHLVLQDQLSEKLGAFKGTKTLSRGDSGRMVRAVQRKLGVKTDGTFSHKTFKAVRQYQRKNSLKVDGIIGRQTISSLGGVKSPPSPGNFNDSALKILRTFVHKLGGGKGSSSGSSSSSSSSGTGKRPKKGKIPGVLLR